jgi:hypothetical protein
MLHARKRSLRTKAEGKKKSAYEKFEIGDLRGAKSDLLDARRLIQDALKLVRSLGERGTSERTICDDIETLWREIILKEEE